MTSRRFVLATVLSALPLFAGPACGEWTEEDFYRKVAPRYVVVPNREPSKAETIIGNVRFYHVRKGDTFLDLARFYGLGYNEIKDANPGVDQGGPPVDQDRRPARG